VEEGNAVFEKPLPAQCVPFPL